MAPPSGACRGLVSLHLFVLPSSSEGVKLKILVIRDLRPRFVAVVFLCPIIPLRASIFPIPKRPRESPILDIRCILKIGKRQRK